MENEILKKLAEQNAKIDAVYISVEKTRRYLQIILWSTVIMFVLPLIGLLIGIPIFLRTYMSAFEGLV